MMQHSRLFEQRPELAEVPSSCTLDEGLRRTLSPDDLRIVDGLTSGYHLNRFALGVLAVLARRAHQEPDNLRIFARGVQQLANADPELMRVPEQMYVRGGQSADYTYSPTPQRLGPLQRRLAQAERQAGTVVYGNDHFAIPEDRYAAVDLTGHRQAFGAAGRPYTQTAMSPEWLAEVFRPKNTQEQGGLQPPYVPQDGERY